jgi:hypothetical protein
MPGRDCLVAEHSRIWGVFVTREHVRHNKSGIAHRGRTRKNHLRELPTVYAAYLEGNKRLRLSQHIMHSAPISRPANTQPTATPAACPLLRPSLSVEGPACSEKGQHVTTAFSIWQLLVFTSEQCAELCDHAWPRVCLMPSSMLQTH